LNADNSPAIRVRGLTKRYGDFEAVRGIDFEVYPGEVFGLLGPNGAGKTTTVEILEGLRPRTSGDVEVLGFDPAVSVKEIKDRIGVALQATNLPEQIKIGAIAHRMRGDASALEIASDNLRRGHEAGVMFVAGSDAGNLLTPHGPTIQRELQLWVKAGVPAAAALRAATQNAARFLRQEDRIGTLRKGFEANLLVVDGNPLEDISALERISIVVFLGERINRAELLKMTQESEAPGS